MNDDKFTYRKGDVELERDPSGKPAKWAVEAFCTGNPDRWGWQEGEVSIVNDDGSLTRIGEIPSWAVYMRELRKARAAAGQPPMTTEEFNTELAAYLAAQGT